ncbi:transcription factor cropped isoform X2 [Oratosquilla oratoria]|uniref:transcription factor cropped isoform X2 n=1 Tax=Oratosquilla oratoria TaxID=337810 RepID=UPI003F76270F
MEMFPRVGEKRRLDDMGIEDEEAIGSLCRLGSRPVSPKTAMEQEKRIRREIANSNERRRMQSINAGFASLKTLLPHHEGEKLSKAAILQQTAEYIYQLEQEKTRLLSQNCQLKRLLNQQQHHQDAEGSPLGGESPSEDKNDTSSDPEAAGTEELRREMIDLRMQLDRERRHRMSLEDHVRNLESQLYPERLKEITQQQVKQEYVKECKESKNTDVKMEAPAVTSIVEVSSSPRPAALTVVKADAFHTTTNTTTTTPRPPTTVLTHHTSTHPTSQLLSQPEPQPQPQLPSENPSIHTTVMSHFPSPAPTIVSAPPAATIVTVVPSNKGGHDTLPSVLEALTSSGRGGAKVEVEPAPRVPSPASTIEYHSTTITEDHSVKGQCVYIVNSTSACQKSLDTICEAIRHLEGDHMFSTEDQHRNLVVKEEGIEEEIITDETVTIEDPMGESGNPLTLHMVPEPQDVPLELTTTHRGENTMSSTALTTLPASTLTTIPTTTLNNLTSSLQAARPGVIVVKHP